MTKLDEKQKYYEGKEAQRSLTDGLPVIVRLDGRSFHNFTKGMVRPYDPKMSLCMQDTTRHLVEVFHPDIGYTQSDEITLIWKNEELNQDFIFGGRLQKLTSILSASASVMFNKLVATHLPEKAELMPTFDARVWQVPNLLIAYENLLWRESDAVKNSITMAASAYYSHKELHGKNSSEKQEMLFQKGVNWNDYPDFFKRGTYFARKKVFKVLPQEILYSIPEAKRPTGPIERHEVLPLDLPILSKIENAERVLFFNEEPILRQKPPKP